MTEGLCVDQALIDLRKGLRSDIEMLSWCEEVGIEKSVIQKGIDQKREAIANFEAMASPALVEPDAL